MTVTLIWPGYSRLSSIFLTTSRASRLAARSSICVRRDEDPHLAPGLDGERLLDAVERVGDAFQRLEALDVGLDHLAARAGRAPLMASAVATMNASTVCGSSSPWCAAIAWTILAERPSRLGDVGADQRVRAFDLVVDGLADVVQQTGGLADVDVGADLGASAAAISETSSEWCSTFWP